MNAGSIKPSLPADAHHSKRPVPYDEGALKLGLAFRIAIFAVVIILTTSLVFNLIVKKRYEKDFREHVENQVEGMARLRSADFAKFLHDNQCDNIRDEIRVDVYAVKEITNISVFDAQGTLVACGGGLIGSDLPDEWTKSALSARVAARRWDGYIFNYFKPITHATGMLLRLPGEDDMIGYLAMRYDATHLRNHMMRTRDYFLGVTLILTFLFTVVGAYFSKRLTKPIAALTKASQRISEGDLSVKVHSKSRDEVGILTENFNAMVGNLRDEIDERKSAEKEVTVAKERLESFINNTSDGVGIIDTEGTVLQVNSAFEKIYGWRAEEIIGIKLPIIPEDYISEFDALIEKVRSGGSVTAHETKRKRRDGSTFDASLTLSAIRNEVGDIVAFAGITRDITEQKKIVEELKSSKETLHNLSSHLHSAREEERMRISREIHDELGQILTALKMDLSWLNTKYGDHRSLMEKTTLMLSLIDSTIKTVKRLCTELRPSVLDDLGLTAAIEWQAGEFQDHTGITCNISFDPENIILDRDRSTVVFRVFQEALTNVVRHADATAIRVDLRKQSGEVTLTVQDNGRGITKEEMSRPQSFGIIGMRERVRFYGGAFTINGARGEGTTVAMRIPVA